MAEEGKKYVLHGMYAECSMGTMKNYLNTDVGHGVVYQGQPLLNANDHTPQINLTHFGDCNSKMIFEEAKKQADEKYKADAGDNFFERAGKAIAKNVTKAAVTVQGCLGVNKCQLDTPLPWKFCNDEHMLDGAPALTIGSVCPCKFGGIISIIDPPDPEPEAGETAEEAEASEAAKAAVELAAGLAAAAAEIAEFEQMLQENYGFDAEQAQLISKAYKAFMDGTADKDWTRKEQLHEFFSSMAGLCINYSGGAFRTKLIFGTKPTMEAMEYFESLGMTNQEVFDLVGAINFQHTEGLLLSRASDYNSQGFCSDPNCNRKCNYAYHITDSKYWNFDYGEAAANKDFAHEIVQYSSFSNESFSRKVWGAFDEALGDANALSGYKGDVFSTRMNIDDMNSDIDAINIYQRMENMEGSIPGIMVDYDKQVRHGTLNRAEEFLKNLGDGDADVGFENLKEELSKVDLASHYIDQGFDMVPQVLQDAFYLNALVEGNAILAGQETFDELLEYTNESKVRNNPDIKKKREEFLEYVEGIWKGGKGT